MLPLLFLFCSFQIFSTVKSGSHSLWVLSTMIIGDTPFPEFSVVVMLDDIQVAYYDSNVKSLIYRQYESENEGEDQKDASWIFGEMQTGLKGIFYKYQFNHTHGAQTVQELVSCELLDDDTPGLLRLWAALNTVILGALQFNTQEKTLQVEGIMHSGNALKHLEMIYSPACFRFLKNSLHVKKTDVMKKVKPRVILLQKTLPPEGVKVTCLATGFYPRLINLTLLRDGQPVSDHQITGGELLPNLDGTYQKRKSLEVSAEELKEKHLYSCTVEHLSLDNKLNVTLDLDPGVGTVSIVIPVVVLGVALLCVVGAVVFMHRRKQPHHLIMAQSFGDSDLEMNLNLEL